MLRRIRASSFLSGLAGGLVAVAIGAVLLATGLVDAGGGDTVIEQQPITRPAANEDSPGMTVNQIYSGSAPGVVFVQAQGGTGTESPFGPPGGGGGAATGSGFVLDKDGNVLTNAHVVDGADEVTVRFGENDIVDAEVVGQDLSTDLAVLKVNPDDVNGGVTPLPLGDSREVKVGDPAIAIGNPLGFDRTITTGIVSAIQRQIEAPNGFSITDVIQTDASINPGNSGGPLLDAAGRVIGINSQIATGGSNGSVGIGFAVPINAAKQVIPQLEEDGEVERAFLGVTTAPVDSQLTEDLNLPADHGALVQAVTPGGPAAKAGIEGGDRETTEGLRVGGDLIVKVDGTVINEPDDVASAISDDKPGDTVELEYYRGDELTTTDVELGKRPAQADVPRPGGGGGRGGQPFRLP